MTLLADFHSTVRHHRKSHVALATVGIILGYGPVKKII